MEARCAPSNGLPLKEQGSHETFTEHMTSENEEKPFSCNECDNKCSRKSNLKVHTGMVEICAKNGRNMRKKWAKYAQKYAQNTDICVKYAQYMRKICAL